MSTPTFIIDAYNVIRHLLSPDEMDGPLEDARRLLEGKLRAYRAASRGARIILVYDGGRGIPPRRREEGFEVHFSRPPRTADDLVLELCRRLEGGPNTHVVTSDFIDIASRIAAFRVRHLTSQAFARLVLERLARSRAAEHPGEDAADGKPGRIGPGEVGDWVRRFGFGEEGGGGGK